MGEKAQPFLWERLHGEDEGYTGILARVEEKVYSETFNPGKHFHDAFELLYVMDGHMEIRLEDATFNAKSGDFCFYSPGLVHDEYVSAGEQFRIFWVLADPAHIAIPPSEIEAIPVVSHLPWRDRFLNIFEQLVLEARNSDRWSEVLIGSYLFQFMVLLQRALEETEKKKAPESDLNTARIAHVISLINSRIDSDMPLKEMAKLAHMSESYFAHVFKDIAGTSPKRFFIDKKLSKAKELLSQTSKSVREIALELGYDNPQYFSRLFKQECNCTPGEYRKNVQ